MTTVASTSYYTSATSYAGRRSADAAENSVFDNAAGDPNSGGQTAESSSDEPASTVDNRPSTATINFQGKLINAIVMDTSKLKRINVSELPEDRYQIFMEQQQQMISANKQYLENQYTQYSEPDYSGDPRLKAYATITVGGQVVAKIDNQGAVESDNALGAQLRDILLGDVNGTNGPDLAQARAEQLAQLLGGRIVKSNTAITQSAFNGLAPFEQPKATIDYEAMKQDPLYERLQAMSANLESTQQKRAQYLAQQ